MYQITSEAYSAIGIASALNSKHGGQVRNRVMIGFSLGAITSASVSEHWGDFVWRVGEGVSDKGLYEFNPERIHGVVKAATTTGDAVFIAPGAPQAEICAAKYKARIQCWESSGEIPVIAVGGVDVDASVVCNGLSAAARLARDIPSGVNYSGVWAEVSAGSFAIVGTDGAVMACTEIEVDAAQPSGVMVHADAAAAAATMLKEVCKGAPSAHVSIADDWLDLRSGDYSIRLRKVASKYADWRKVVASQAGDGLGFSVHAPDVISAMACVAQDVAQDDFVGIHLRVTGGALDISCGESLASVDVKSEGDAHPIKMNRKNLDGVLLKARGVEITWPSQQEGHGTGLLVRDDSTRYVIMPMR